MLALMSNMSRARPLDFSGERGGNRTFNLEIKSLLLCQLSYAPTAHGGVGTNLDYTIRVLHRPRASEPPAIRRSAR